MIIEIPINKIKLPKHRKVNKNDENYKLLVESVRKMGMLNPVLIDTKNRLIDGLCRISALLEIGYTGTVKCLVSNLLVQEDLTTELFVHEEYET